ncbi:hypothetical protein GCM10022233_04320 [Streptomyces shaanxiensis]|uniref:Uncharacterized protein n=1 Tax=Streptomyces shaanxiensis TaxID=653357 RepID=A0ABP7UAE8_9ACTN
MRMRQQHLPYATQRTPRPSSRERRAGRQIEQQRPVHEQRGRRPRIITERTGTRRARTVGAGESRGGTGAEESQFHGPIFAGREWSRAPAAPKGRQSGARGPDDMRLRRVGATGPTARR